MAVHIESVSAMVAFVHTADMLSFKMAGQQLGLSSSAIGKSIARLEDQLGVRLFHRSTRSIALTHEGELFLDRCRRILSEVEAAQGELAHATALPRGRLRVSLPLTGSLLTPLFGEFLELYPEIELDLDYNDHFVDVIEDGYDAVIRTGDANDSRLMHRSLGSFSWRLVASPGYLEKRGVPTELPQLASHACLHHRYPATGKLAPWGLAMPDDVALPTTLSATTIEPLIALAEMGRGIACLPYFSVRDQLSDGTLLELFTGALEQTGTLRLLWPSSRFPLPKVAAFVAFMSKRVAAELDVR